MELNQPNISEKPQEEGFTENDPLKEKIEELQVIEPRQGTCMNIVRSVTVEPCMVMFVLGFLICTISTQNLTLEKACRVNLNYTDEICTSLRLQTIEAQTIYEKTSQSLMASATAQKTYIVATIPVLSSLLIGSWSDKTGHRKIFIVIPVFGQLLMCILNIINAYYLNELSLEYLVFGEAIMEGLTGSWCITSLAVNSYLCSITCLKTRTFRLGILNFCSTAGFPVGSMIGGIVLKKFGYFGSYGLAGTVHAINLIYTVFILKDPIRSKEQKEHDNKGVIHFFRTFFDLSNAKESINVIFKKGPNNRRRRVCVLLFVECVLFGPMLGELSILYIYTRFRYSWDELKISIFQTYNFILHTIGTLFSIVVLSKMWQWHDSALGITSSISKIASSFVYCFAPNGRILFLAPVLDILNGTGLLAVKSTLTKLVESNELGKVNSICGVTQNLMPLFYVSLYTYVYTATMQVLPGAVFLLGSAMVVPALLIFWRREPLKLPEDKNPQSLKSPKGFMEYFKNITSNNAYYGKYCTKSPLRMMNKILALRCTNTQQLMDDGQVPYGKDQSPITTSKRREPLKLPEDKNPQSLKSPKGFMEYFKNITSNNAYYGKYCTKSPLRMMNKILALRCTNTQQLMDDGQVPYGKDQSPITTSK